MKQTLFLLPKDDSRNSADKQTHKKKATLCLCLFLCTGVAFPNDLAAKAAPATNKTGKRNDHRLQRNTDHRRQCGRRWND